MSRVHCNKLTLRVLTLLAVLVALTLAPLPSNPVSGGDIPTELSSPRVVDAQMAPFMQNTSPLAPSSPNEESHPPGIMSASVDADGNLTTWVMSSSPDQASFQPNDCTLPPPTLISPVGGGQVNTLVPYFQWSRTGVRYRVQISTESSFSILVYHTTWFISGSGNPNVDLAFNLVPNMTYYWRVASVCDDYQPGSFSQSASFRTGNVTGPFVGPPVMISPANGAVQSSLEVQFSWGNVSGATAWQLRMYNSLSAAQNDDEWNQMSWGAWSRSWRNSTGWTFGSSGTYYWRIAAGTDAGWGPLSPVRSLTVSGTASYTVSGRVITTSGTGVGGATIRDNAGHTTVTNSSGYYTLAGLSQGAYTITPSKSGYAFCPTERRITVSSNVSGQDFAGFGATVTLGFCPNPNGYSFSNSNSGWGSFPFSAYDYGYTELIRMFGQDDVCWMTGPVCWVKPQADLWHLQANLSMNGGHCDGMASTSLRFFKGVDQPSDFKPNATTGHELGLGDARRHIAYYFVEQLTDPVLAYKNQIRQNTLTAILNQLRSGMQSGAPDPTTLFVRQSGQGGHAITPFAIEDRANGISWVRVYDNNHPDDLGRYVVINTIDQTWSYNLGSTTWTGDANTQTMGIVPISEYAEQPICPWCDGSLEMTEPDNPLMQEIWLNGSGHLLVTDAQGRRIGYVGVQFVSDIPGAYGGFIDGGLGIAQEPIYKLPVSDSYTILLNGQTATQPENATVSQFGPGYSAQINNIRLQTSVRDSITIAADGSQITYQPNGTRNPTLSLALDDAATSYELGVVGAEIDTGQRVTVAAQESTGRLVYSNAQASGGDYGLFVRRVSSSGVQLFAHSTLTVAGGDTHYAAYRSWDGQGPMTLLIDHASNGTIDETVTLENQIRSVYLPKVVGN